MTYNFQDFSVVKVHGHNVQLCKTQITFLKEILTYQAREALLFIMFTCDSNLESKLSQQKELYFLYIGESVHINHLC
jgi:hypothetical protein